MPFTRVCPRLFAQPQKASASVVVVHDVARVTTFLLRLSSRKAEPVSTLPQDVTPKTRLLRRAKMIALKVASRKRILSAK